MPGVPAARPTMEPDEAADAVASLATVCHGSRVAREQTCDSVHACVCVCVVL